MTDVIDYFVQNLKNRYILEGHEDVEVWKTPLQIKVCPEIYSITVATKDKILITQLSIDITGIKRTRFMEVKGNNKSGSK